MQQQPARSAIQRNVKFRDCCISHQTRNTDSGHFHVAVQAAAALHGTFQRTRPRHEHSRYIKHYEGTVQCRSKGAKELMPSTLPYGNTFGLPATSSSAYATFNSRECSSLKNKSKGTCVRVHKYHQSTTYLRTPKKTAKQHPSKLRHHHILKTTHKQNRTRETR